MEVLNKLNENGYCNYVIAGDAVEDRAEEVWKNGDVEYIY